jgi:hypothetical protein
MTMATETLYHGTASTNPLAGLQAGACWTRDIRAARAYAEGYRSTGGVVRVLCTVVDLEEVAPIEFGEIGSDDARLAQVRASGKAWGVCDGGADVDVSPENEAHDCFVAGRDLEPADVWVDQVLNRGWHEVEHRVAESVLEDLEIMSAKEALGEEFDLASGDEPLEFVEEVLGVKLIRCYGR